MTLDEIRAFAPGAERFGPGLMMARKRFDLSSPLRLAMFMAQVAHESGGFAYTRELWGPTEQQRKYEPPGAVAAALGNTQAGDGLRFRGRGLIQVTGRANTLRCSMFLFGDDRLVLDPAWLEGVEGAPLSAGWFWSTHDLNALADTGDFAAVTRRINGGLNGLASRQAWLAKARAVWP